jgi:Protein of unknown function (DUF2934)
MPTRRPTEPTRTAEPAPGSDKSPPARRAAPVKTAAVSPASTPLSTAGTAVTVSAGTRRAMIEQAAYLRAERRGFAPGSEVEDWLAAEAEVDALLKAGNGRPPQ